MAKIIGNTTATPMAVPDWNQTDPTKADYIKNKPASPKVSAVNLLASGWTGSGAHWTQMVGINDITVNSKIDIQPTVDQIASLQAVGAMMTIENNNGAATAHVIGNKPNIDYTFKILITEEGIG